MTFVDRLREYLRRAASSPVWEPPFPEVELASARAHFLDGLERLERQVEPAKIEALHAAWTADDRLASFVRTFTEDHAARFGRAATRQPLQDLVDAAIDAQLGLPLTGPLAWRLEIQTAAQRAWLGSAVSNRRAGLTVGAYALEVRAVRMDADHRVSPTPVGRVALELAGMDLVRWLLQVEAEQALGPRDPWRLSREGAALLAARRRDMVPEYGMAEPAIETLARLYDLGILDQLSRSEDRQWWTYAVRDAAVPVLEEIAGTEETPLRVLAATLLGDDRNAALASAQPTLASLFGEAAAAAGIRQARLVAHEVRNSLVPVQVALEGLFRALEPIASDRLDKYRGRIDDGVNRVFKFVDETLRVLTIAAEPAEAFDVSSALRDALGPFTAGEAEITEVVPAPGELPPVVGVRSRFVLAIVNLVRNAAQSVRDRKARVEVTAGLAADARSIVIAIDDDGPGVPAAHRESIFARGFSLRPGGTGMGLALTREVVEKELGGKVACVDSPLGGARFELSLPIIGKGAP